MGKFYNDVTKPANNIDVNKKVHDTPDGSAASARGGEGPVLMQNGKPVTVDMALKEIDSAVEQPPEMIKRDYLPLKQPGGPLASSFKRFMMITAKDDLGFPEVELEERVRNKAKSDWVDVVDALCNEDINSSPSYRAFLLGRNADMKQRKEVQKLAIEYNDGDTTPARKEEILEKIAEMTWQNLLTSSVAVVIESGLGMDIDASGANKEAVGLGGARAGAANEAIDIILDHNKKSPSPLVAQVDRCSKLLAEGAGSMRALHTVVVGWAEMNERDGMFYPSIACQLGLSREHLQVCKKADVELVANEKAWGPLKPEASFVSANRGQRVAEVTESMTSAVEEKHSASTPSLLQRAFTKVTNQQSPK